MIHGASNMSGKYKGVQAIVRAEYLKPFMFIALLTL